MQSRCAPSIEQTIFLLPLANRRCNYGQGAQLINDEQGLGAAQDAARMQRVVSFYEKLPRGPAPETKAKGLIGRYQAKYFGKEPSAARTLHP